jgi:hypothetical protein
MYICMIYQNIYSEFIFKISYVFFFFCDHICSIQSIIKTDSQSFQNAETIDISKYIYCNSSVKSGLCDADYRFKIYRIPTSCVWIDLSVLKNMVGNTYSTFCGTTKIHVMRPLYKFSNDKLWISADNIFICKENEAHMGGGHDVRKYNIVKALIYSCNHNISLKLQKLSITYNIIHMALTKLLIYLQ